MVDKRRREMFADIYRLAEYCENPPFKPGDIDGNASFFDVAIKEQLLPLVEKYKDIPLANKLAMAILEDCDRKAAEMNKM